MNNQKGFADIFLIIFFLVIVCGITIFDVDNVRIAIADDIKKSTLIETTKSKNIIKEVDYIMNKNILKFKQRGYNGRWLEGIQGFQWQDHSWMTLFWAKIQLERARLEMEIEANKR